MISRHAREGEEITEHVSAERRELDAHMAIVSKYAKPARDAFVKERGVNRFYPLLRNPGIALIGKIADEEAGNPHLRDFFSNVIANPRGPQAIAHKLGTAKLVLNNTNPSREVPKQIEYFLQCAVKDTVNVGNTQKAEQKESPWEKLSRECGMKHLGAQLFQPQGLFEYLEDLCLELNFARRGLSEEEEEKMCKIIYTYEQLAEGVRIYLEKNAQEVAGMQQGTSDEVASALPQALSKPRGSANVIDSFPAMMATAIAKTARTIRAAANNLRA